MTFLFDLLTSSGGQLVLAIGAGIAALVAAYAKGHSNGEAKAEAKRAQEEIDALEDRLEMYRDADAAEREAAGMSDDDALKEAMKWSRPPSR